MRASYQRKLPEEIELEHKQVELAALRSQHEEARAALQQVREVISRFERQYEQTVGKHIAALEALEVEISRLTGYAEGKGPQEENGSTGNFGDYSRFSSRKGEADQEPADDAADANAFASHRGENLDIRSLYREVAKAIHPDLADSDAEETARHELMSQANRAYAQKDRRTLQEILRKWRPVNPNPSKKQQQEPLDIAHQLVQVIRQIAQEREDIAAAFAKAAELKESYVYRFKERVDASLAQGVDLLGQMMAAAQLNIARAKKRLAALKGEQPQAAARADKVRREICFPTDHFDGTLYLRDRASLNYSQWKKIGPAKGCLQVGDDQAVRLDVKADAAARLSQMRNLKPNDLQSLFLYEVGDSDLDSIMHLTGLEELYLSGERLTDAALSGVAKLTNLQRIYLYQTVITDRGLAHLAQLPSLKGLTLSGNSITDEGLAIFQKAIPGVKTVSFPWRYNK